MLKSSILDVTEADLLDISQKLFNLAKEQFSIKYSVNFGQKISENSNSDASPENLFQSLDENELTSHYSIYTFLPLMDNYNPDVKQEEDHSAEEQKEEEKFVSAILETMIMQETVQFLIAKNVVENENSFIGKVCHQSLQVLN